MTGGRFDDAVCIFQTSEASLLRSNVTVEMCEILSEQLILRELRPGNSELWRTT